ncbi:DUF3012 domain-containing protein [Shewanella sp. Choline-02u-19]|jgi:hypothetical protein|uniref:DUF3012 domain-containing protein n=1 Tax=unclassified Shewanella TaxID=196818 RepID=UPI000C3461B2|nr:MULTISPECIES: DUF3012 domain-containing protein [unclassified Shewanella]PKG56897.1 DUF3012 domain-containing protein [Shewanella sp. GutDb-MelDb]PKG74408.1 DUF3012 domain-containing protein [Shewanella sp. GutCb]PKH57766.1 DUF3012 domain-containing protein [Shewanella sp. Bg11-22]PKI29815.1 DUF3012 domain-containing protein [Shewanella sp. Choline-02u-19]
MSLSKLSATCLALVLAMGMTACAPEVGSEAWCQQMSEKPSGDWSTNEATDYAKHCVFK